MFLIVSRMRPPLLHITIESLLLLIVIAECWVSLYQIS
jgi:hypothetical protein